MVLIRCRSLMLEREHCTTNALRSTHSQAATRFAATATEPNTRDNGAYPLPLLDARA
jgi:hypothetical protein